MDRIKTVLQQWPSAPWPRQPHPRVPNLAERVARIEHQLWGDEPPMRAIRWLEDLPEDPAPMVPLCERRRAAEA